MRNKHINQRSSPRDLMGAGEAVSLAVPGGSRCGLVRRHKGGAAVFISGAAAANLSSQEGIVAAAPRRFIASARRFERAGKSGPLAGPGPLQRSPARALECAGASP